MPKADTTSTTPSRAALHAAACRAALSGAEGEDVLVIERTILAKPAESVEDAAAAVAAAEAELVAMLEARDLDALDREALERASALLRAARAVLPPVPDEVRRFHGLPAV